MVADKRQTGLDVIQTGKDVIQTGEDVTTVADSARTVSENKAEVERRIIEVLTKAMMVTVFQCMGYLQPSNWIKTQCLYQYRKDADNVYR